MADPGELEAFKWFGIPAVVALVRSVMGNGRRLTKLETRADTFVTDQALTPHLADAQRQVATLTGELGALRHRASSAEREQLRLETQLQDALIRLARLEGRE